MKKQFIVTEEGSICMERTLCDLSAAPCADFELREDKTAVLLRWPRDVKKALLPERISEYSLTEISPLAFAAFHFPDTVWQEFERGYSRSFSVFCVTHAGLMQREEREEGGPVEVVLPKTVTEIGQYAFWHCDRLVQVQLPKGVRHLREGTFGECSRLSKVTLPDDLEEIGSFVPDNVHAMPDIGTFSGCHALKRLALPERVVSIGAEVFNSCGLEELAVRTKGTVRIHATAFEHTAGLQWMTRMEQDRVLWQIGLPAARDKILSCDREYQVISRLPYLFFEKSAKELDEIARKTFRLDFSGRMAIARLRYPEYLEQDMRIWYLHLLIEYFDRLEQFWPACEDSARAAFELLKDTEGFDAQFLGELMGIAGRAHMDMDLIYEMMELRNRRFSMITGLESLEL